tara:strand:- start:1088 stop:1573 length:486 start_codon:yes stop_codon:yes gene_type:complete
VKKKNYHSKYSKIYVGIDPGKSGGICVIEDKFIKAYPCPENIQDMALMFAMCISVNETKTVVAYIEKVWARPHDAKGSIWKFAENYGTWLGIAGAYEIDLQKVSPQAWMKYIEVPKLDKPRRKRYLRDKARSMYPSLKKVTLKTADAILIATYAKETDNDS